MTFSGIMTAIEIDCIKKQQIWDDNNKQNKTIIYKEILTKE